MRAQGHVFKYGDNVDTDVIIPARYLNSFDAKELASHAMADIDPEFAKKVQAGDLIVAKKNFGCGSSREHAPLCLKTAGVSCVIAETFARIFYRNAINIGLPIIECPQAAQEIEAQPVIQSGLDQRCQLLIFLDLLSDLFFFFFGHVSQVQFISKCTCHCHCASR